MAQPDGSLPTTTSVVLTSLSLPIQSQRKHGEPKNRGQHGVDGQFSCKYLEIPFYGKRKLATFREIKKGKREREGENMGFRQQVNTG